MAPKGYKNRRLQELKNYVTHPGRLSELRARDGDSLQGKLRRMVPGERIWKDFLLHSTFDKLEQKQVDELNLLVLGDNILELHLLRPAQTPLLLLLLRLQSPIS